MLRTLQNYRPRLSSLIRGTSFWLRDKRNGPSQRRRSPIRSQVHQERQQPGIWLRWGHFRAARCHIGPRAQKGSIPGIVCKLVGTARSLKPEVQDLIIERMTKLISTRSIRQGKERESYLVKLSPKGAEIREYFAYVSLKCSNQAAWVKYDKYHKYTSTHQLASN